MTFKEIIDFVQESFPNAIVGMQSFNTSNIKQIDIKLQRGENEPIISIRITDETSDEIKAKIKKAIKQFLNDFKH